MLESSSESLSLGITSLRNAYYATLLLCADDYFDYFSLNYCINSLPQFHFFAISTVELMESAQMSRRIALWFQKRTSMKQCNRNRIQMCKQIKCRNCVRIEKWCPIDLEYLEQNIDYIWADKQRNLSLEPFEPEVVQLTCYRRSRLYILTCSLELHQRQSQSKIVKFPDARDTFRTSWTTIQPLNNFDIREWIEIRSRKNTFLRYSNIFSKND